MTRIAVAGTDTVVGHAVLSELAGSAQVTKLTLRPRLLPAIADLNDSARQDPESTLAGATAVVFCGAGSRSTWDPVRSNLEMDEEWLPAYLEAARRRRIPLTYVSSDAVFRGPWMFHDEDAASFDDSETALRLLALERQVLQTPENLVVRTNVIGSTGHGDTFLDTVLEATHSHQRCKLSSASWATPLAATVFAPLLSECLKAKLTGTVHLAGAERISPWSLARHLAAELGSHRSLFIPALHEQPGTERSLRCSRARQELGLRMPTLNQSLDAVVESLQAGLSELAAA